MSIQSLENKNEELRKKLLNLELRRERWKAVQKRIKDIVPTYYTCELEIEFPQPAEQIKIDFEILDNGDVNFK